MVRFKDGGGNVISGNEIYNGGSNTSDCGGVYAWQTNGGTISDNLLHDLEGPGVGMAGLYLDHNCSNMRVFRNVIQRTHSGIRLNTPTLGNVIANNTIDATTTHSLRSWPDANLGGSQVANNYFPTWINPDFSNVDWKSNVMTATNKFAAAATGDFRPTLGSPLIDAGTLISSITNLFLGLAPDAGAVEFDPLGLTGVAAAMDANGEWYASAGTATLLDTSRAQSPFAVEVRTRLLAIDLWHKSYVTFKGINLLGATVRTSVMSNGDVLDGVKADYYGFIDVVESGFYGSWDDHNGIELLGNNHTVKNCVLRFAEGNGVLLKGNGNVVQNSVIENVGIYGTDAAAVKIYG
ncbi:MAG: hypothetical protein EOO74_12150, partial [Myxococcales bacterium]